MFRIWPFSRRRVRPEQPSHSYVFVSYSRNEPDASYVARLVVELTAAGIPAWYDQRIVTGDRWERELRARVDGCAALIVVMSPNSEASPWVQLELGRATNRRRPVRPILFAGERFARLVDLQYEAVRDGQILPSAEFVNALRTDLADFSAPSSRRRTAELAGRGLPLRNPHFVGRGRALLDIEAGLYWGSSIAVLALVGTGGIGKTQLAAEYAHRRREDYDLIVWIDSENPDLIAGQLAELAPRLGVPAGQDAFRTAGAVIAALGVSSLAWLIVFDNAESPKNVVEWLPRYGAGHVIVTSRQTGWGGLGSTVDIDVMAPDEAVTLLRNRVPSVDVAVAGEIVEWLGLLPLAVEQAAGYLATTGIPAADYLRLLKSRGEELLAEGEAPVGYDHTLATVWDVSRRSLHDASPAAEQLLRLCAFLGPEPIRLDLFTQHPEVLPAPLSHVVDDEIRVNEVVGALVSHSLVRRNESGISVHRLLATAVRRPLPEAERLDAIATVRGLLYQHLPEKIVRTPEHWPVWRDLLPHVLAAAAQTSPHRGESDRTAWLLDRAATFLRSQGQPAAAKPHFERALQITDTALGPDHPDVATRLGNLAGVLRELGDPAAAKPLYERALRIGEATLGPDHPTAALRLGNLAGVLRQLGDPEAAKPLYERALRIGETALGPDHPDVATRLGNLAGVLRELGDPAAAKPLYERALRIGEATLGPDHPTVALRLGNLAGVLRELGDPAAAKPLYERALRIGEATLGPDHPAVATRLNNLAMTVHELGDSAAAQPLLERALRMGEATYGSEHPAVAVRLRNLGTVLSQLGERVTGIEMLQRALRIHESAYGPDHPAVATDLDRLASMLEQSDPAAATLMRERALRIRSSVYGSRPADDEDDG